MSLVYALCGAVSFLVCVAAGRIGSRLGLMDRPDGKRKLHSRPTPLVGGVAVILPLLTMSVALALATGEGWLFGSFILGVAGYFVIGLCDDLWFLSPRTRLAASFLAALLTVSLMPLFTLEVLSFGFGGRAISLGTGATLFTVVCIVGLTNALNFADGRNGVAIGLSLIWTVLLLAYAPPILHPVLYVMAGTLALTLAFNLRGVLFLGDAGTYGLGMAVALISIYAYNLSPRAFPAEAGLLLFLVPVLDCLRLILVRIAHRRSPFAADRNHLHHLLQSRMSGPMLLLTYWGMVGIPSGLALLFPGYTAAWVTLAVAGYVTALWSHAWSKPGAFDAPIGKLWSQVTQRNRSGNR